MSIAIELSHEQIQKIQADVIRKVTAQLERDVLASLNTKQVSNEVKNAAAKILAERMALDAMHTARVDEALHRAIQSAESRVTSQIHRALSSGITVRFSGIEALT